MVAPIFFPTNSVGRFPSRHILASIYYLWIFWWWSFWLAWGGLFWSFWWTSHCNLGFLFNKESKNLIFNQSCLFFFIKMQHLHVEFTLKCGCTSEMKDTEICECVTESACVYRGPMWTRFRVLLTTGSPLQMAAVTEHNKLLLSPLQRRNPAVAPGEREFWRKTEWCVVIHSCLTLQPPELWRSRLFCPWHFPGKNTGMGSYSLLQGIFPIQGSNTCLLWLLHWQAGSFPLAPPGKALEASESESRSVVSDSLWLHGLHSPRNSPG